MTAPVAAPCTFLPVDYPEGVWRLPLSEVLAATNSAYRGLIQKRIARDERVDAVATVFQHRGDLFAQVEFQNPRYATLVFQLYRWPLGGPTPPATFGKRVAS